MATGTATGNVEASGKLTQEDISKLYVAIFNRASEGEGNLYWQTQGSLAEVADKMLATDDAKEYFGDALNDNKAFIEWIYKNTFSKSYEDDPEGIDYWTEKLLHGESRGQVVADIVTAATAPENAGEAQTQFMHRVEISNHMADTIFNVVDNYKIATGFDADLKVTADEDTLKDAMSKIDHMAGDVEASLSWAVENGIISDSLADFISEDMDKLKSDFSEGIKVEKEKMSSEAANLHSDVDAALEKLDGLKSEFSNSLKNILSFLDHAEADQENKADSDSDKENGKEEANGEHSTSASGSAEKEDNKLGFDINQKDSNKMSFFNSKSNSNNDDADSDNADNSSHASSNTSTHIELIGIDTTGIFDGDASHNLDLQ